MEIKITVLKTITPTFTCELAKYKDDFLRILSSSYSSYYGDDYQLKRIIEEQSVVYLATIDDILVGVSYIKKNFRRGGTAVFPKQYRRMGVAEKLVKESLKLFPKQYTILRVDNYKMLSLMRKIGFKKANSVQEIENIVQGEFSLLSNFKFSGDYLIFNRYSFKRNMQREKLTLLHTFF